MEAIKFKGSNVVFAENQPEYAPLPALVIDDKQGTVITAWKMSEEELEEVKRTGIVYLQQLTFLDRLQPVYLSTSLADLATFEKG